jgi:kynurenine formamidase
MTTDNFELNSEAATHDTSSINTLLEIFKSECRVFELGHELFDGIPQSDQHPKYQHVIPRRHGDIVRGDGSSGANDLLMMGTHVGTHIDALSHISSSNYLHGGVAVTDVQTQRGFSQHGVEKISPIIIEVVLLDIPRALNVACCAPGYAITIRDLQLALEREKVTLRPDLGIFIRTGWGSHFLDAGKFSGELEGSPGISEECALWLAESGVKFVGCDTVSIDPLPLGNKKYGLPAHKVLIFDYGIYVIEALDLEEVAEKSIYTFIFVALPLKLRGATASPIRPIAIANIS